MDARREKERERKREVRGEIEGTRTRRAKEVVSKSKLLMTINHDKIFKHDKGVPPRRISNISCVYTGTVLDHNWSSADTVITAKIPYVFFCQNFLSINSLMMTSQNLYRGTLSVASLTLRCACMRYVTRFSLVLVMACRLPGTELSPKPVLFIVNWIKHQ